MDSGNSETLITREQPTRSAMSALLKLGAIATSLFSAAGFLWLACTAPSAPSVAFAQPEAHLHRPHPRAAVVPDSPGLVAFQAELSGLKQSVDLLESETRRAAASPWSDDVDSLLATPPGSRHAEHTFGRVRTKGTKGLKSLDRGPMKGLDADATPLLSPKPGDLL